MVLTISPRLKTYRRFELDIWGLCYTSYHYKLSNIFFFIKKYYRIDESIFLDFLSDSMFTKIQRIFYNLYKIRQERRNQQRKRYIYKLKTQEIHYKRKILDERFTSVRLTRLYFFKLKDHQFRKLFKQASKLDGNLESNYCYLLEGRLSSIVYRSQMLTNPFDIIKFIMDDYVRIDFRIINKFYYLVPIGKFVTFDWKIWPRLFSDFIRRARNKVLLFSPPRFLFISHTFNFIYLLKLPMKRDLIYPIAIDMQRLTGYY